MRISAIATSRGLHYPESERLARYLKGKQGEWLVIDMTSAAKHDCPKTKEQLGYYWAVLLPAVHRELFAQGYTKSIRILDRNIESELSQDDVHEALTQVCGRIGGDSGYPIRLSDCNLHECTKFIDNVLSVASQLSMNMDQLESWRHYELQPHHTGGSAD